MPSQSLRKYDFNEIIDRSNTQCLKWDFLPQFFGKKVQQGDPSKLLPFWIADMDFRAPEPLIIALEERIKHGIFGYSGFSKSYYESVISWFKRRHGWDIKREWFIFTPGIIPAINFIIQEFSEVGDKIIVQNPVYYPFFESIKNNRRQIQLNPLKIVDDHYEMDFENLKQQMEDPKVKIMILCSPHNPVGRVWTKSELKKVGDLCLEHNILLISDEIHSDIIYSGYTHTNFASISDEFSDYVITCTSASKTFNLAGLQTSNIIIKNEQLRNRLKQRVLSAGIQEPNPIGALATEICYKECEDWVDQLIDYLQSNLGYIKNFVREYMPEIKVFEPQGTYLVWVDFRAWKKNFHELEDFMLNKAQVALDEGYIFGPGGEGFERFNIATPRIYLKECFDRIYRARKEEMGY